MIKNGNESPAQLLSNGDNYLLFNAYLQGDMIASAGGGEATPAVVNPGNFESLANFTLSYQ
ncbi:Fimbria A protein precursor [compost metagenome]